MLLWSSGAIVSEIGLHYGSPFALLLLRYGVALGALTIVALRRGRFLPRRESIPRVIGTGFAIAGVYSSCYLLAMEHGLRPGMLATLLGIQPLVTLAVTEHRFSARRVGGLLFALAGVAMIVWDGMAGAQFGVTGLVFALLSLCGITGGTIWQKRETQAPWDVLPLQYATGLAVVLLVSPFEPFHLSMAPAFLLSALWLGLAISVGASFALYRLIATGNLVNVTSSLYLVPGVTAVMDWLLLGHAMAPLGWAGLGAIVAGLAMTFR
ncbi:putative DMT superfamily transporter [Novosphingobium nitrogenifigens DSM 19370]|uniref:Putative DMT superfamily transporter n=1 Tax=Novosphingobium nitrogenifigens DSM 19370 TaxID=983920 RepID=F1ZDC8_9SPHN|nr:putative DMT superfamily transporter [Novosphingobium nitrogenifigens DSM 19370]